MTPPNPNKPSDLVHESELRTEDLNVNISTLSSSRAAPLPDKYIEQMFSLGHGLPLRRAIFDKSAVERIEVGTAVALLANGCPRRMDVSSAGESAYRIATSTGVHRADEAGRCGTSTEQSNVSVLWGPGLKGTDITDKDSERAYIRQFNLTMEGDTSGFLILESADNTAMTDKTPALTTMTEYLHALGKGRDGCANAEMLVLVTGTTKATAFYGATVQRLPEQNPQDSATKELFVMLDGLGDYTCDVSGVRLVRHHYACTGKASLTSSRARFPLPTLSNLNLFDD
ncbi:hypothetical protein C8Q78DRAFT_556474 [Trametes maxima]|nr:hypothetical protein C8Q78DRAFT_556474 [Trametes maxima]